MVRKKNRLLTDALREVWKTRNRFFSLFLLCALAVAFLSGLRTTSPDMKYTADLYFDAQNLMDVRMLSTQGLTQDDIKAMAALDGVAAAEGSRSFDAVCGERILSVISLPEKINLPALREGRLPQAEGECLAERMFMNAVGLKVGDEVRLDLAASNREGDLTRDRFTIVGVADSPMYISVDRGSSSLGTGRVNALLMVPDGVFTIDYYTAAYVTLEGLAQLDCYSDAYKDAVDAFVERSEDFADRRAQVRYDEIVAEAQEEWNKAKAEYDEAKADADAELADAEAELLQARAELDDGWAELEQGRAELRRETARAEAELRDAYEQLQDAVTKYNDGAAQYEQGRTELEENRRVLEGQQQQLDASRAELDSRQAQADASRAELEAGLAQYEAAVSAYPVSSVEYEMIVTQLAEQKAQLDAGLAQLDAAQIQLNEARAQLEEGQARLDAGWMEFGAGEARLTEVKAELDAAWSQIIQGQEDYNAGRSELESTTADAQAELEQAERELKEGETEYADALSKYEKGRTEADEELADGLRKLNEAQEEIDAIEPGEWYVLDRNTLAGYVTYGSDSERMSNLADVFPVVFFLVAALACLTTMTRMVEEQRTQIGSLKALGFTRRDIAVKYIGYAFAASFFGGIVGAVFGCIVIPLVIYNAWGIMYTLPDMSFLFQPVICALAILAAVACTVGASLAACLATLTATPAALMRPRAPKAGRRVLLERVGPLWSRLSFTRKVTVRNLFRYKQRFWMTVIGIGGCTALIVTGFGLHNSIFDILTKQYDEITPYDASLGISDDITGEEMDAVIRSLEENEQVRSYLTSCQSTVDVDSSAGVVEGVNLFAVTDMEHFREYVRLRHRTDNTPVTLPENGIVITEKLSELLEVDIGDSITVSGDRRVKVTVGDIVENYVYHYIYLTEDYYEALFGERPTANAIMLNFANDTDTVSDQVSTQLMKLDGVSSYTHIAYIRDTFTDSMASIDYAVVIIILAAAALAFVVLYNLTNINITERLRELATLKVLGFYDVEVSAYVYRENIFLTIFGVGLGLVGGRFLHSWLVRTVEINMVMFGRTAPASSYILAAVLTAVFSVIVNIVAHHSLKKIDMVESLKTVE